MAKNKNPVDRFQCRFDAAEEEIKKEIKASNSKETTIQNLWDAAKAVLRGKFIEILAFLKKEKLKFTI